MMLNKLSLNTIGLNRIGLNRIGKPSHALSDRPYIDPEVLASLKAVCICYGKSNDDPDRAIVKNLVDTDNPFVISNAAYKLNSGFGKYETELSDTKIWTQSKETTSTAFSSSYNGLSGWIIFANTELTNSADMPSFKIQVKGLLEGQELIYRYYDSAGQSNVYSMAKDGEYTLPADIRTAKPLVSNTSGLQVVKNENNIITITQIPQFEGAFVTDGVDDLITSTKTVQDMLGGSNEITVVSMIHQIDTDANNFITTNNLRNADRVIGRNIVSKIGKTGIYGWYKKDIQGTTATLISDILGDKNDYAGHYTESTNPITNSKFYVTGYAVPNGFAEISSVAWYWTVIANKVLTTDQINQVIAYFNLDRCVEPTVWYDVQKQGLTNDTPAADWYLKDFSKNGFDMSLFNFAKKGGSGVAAKQGETIKDYSIIKDEEYQELTIYNEFKYKIESKLSNRYWTVQYINRSDTSYPITIVTDKDAFWINSVTYYDVDNNKQTIRKEIAVPANTPTNVLCCGYDQFDIPEDATSIVSAVSYIDYNAAGEITVEFIPSCKGGLITDGVNDYGQFAGDLGLKDYTIVVDRAYDRIALEQVPFIASISANGQAPFLMEYLNLDGSVYPHSFGTTTKTTNLNIQRQISYQSTYVYNGNTISKGTSTDTGDGLTIGNSGSTGTQYSPLCLWSLLLFPYSMSEFLIERQLKKRKAGTLYPDMVEFRPVIKSNIPIETFLFAKKINGEWNNDLKIGDWLEIGTRIAIQFKVTNDTADISELTSVICPQLGNISFVKNNSNVGHIIYGDITSKSPQKIDITIDEYIRYEDIVQPYPSLFTLIDYDTKETYSWGSKPKVGAKFTGKVINLLPDMYQWDGDVLYNGKTLNWGINPGIVAKEMIFSWSKPFKYLFDNNAPKCILSPNRLRIPNSSYKILGYIPDLSGNGNHGIINNSAYAEGSGVNADGSYQLDGVDDFITIPTTVGGKQVIMKVIWDDVIADAILYDQRGYANEFAIYNADNDNSGNPVTAYQARNNGKTYIDGILNSNIKASELKNVNHIITITNELSSGANSKAPVIGANAAHSSFFAQMSLYDFLLFDEISTDEEILTLNEYIGIEGNTDDLFTENN